MPSEHHSHHLFHRHYPQLCRYSYDEKVKLDEVQDLANRWCTKPSHYLRAAAMYQKFHPKREASGFYLGGFQSIEAVLREDGSLRDETCLYYWHATQQPDKEDWHPGLTLLMAADAAEAQGR